MRPLAPTVSRFLAAAIAAHVTTTADSHLQQTDDMGGPVERSGRIGSRRFRTTRRGRARTNMVWKRMSRPLGLADVSGGMSPTAPPSSSRIFARSATTVCTNIFDSMVSGNRLSRDHCEMQEFHRELSGSGRIRGGRQLYRSDRYTVRRSTRADYQANPDETTGAIAGNAQFKCARLGAQHCSQAAHWRRLHCGRHLIRAICLSAPACETRCPPRSPRRPAPARPLATPASRSGGVAPPRAATQYRRNSPVSLPCTRICSGRYRCGS